MAKISTLTVAQEALLPVYRDKWIAIAHSTTPLERTAAQSRIEQAYRALNQPLPEVRFFASPYGVYQELLQQPSERIVEQLGAPLVLPLVADFWTQVNGQLDSELSAFLGEQLQPNNTEIESIIQAMVLIAQQIEQQASVQNRKNFAAVQQLLREQMLQHFWLEQQDYWRAETRKLLGGDWLLEVSDRFWQTVGEPLWEAIGEPLMAEVNQNPMVQSWQQEIQEPLNNLLDLVGFSYSVMRPSFDLTFLSVIDYCVSVLDCECDRAQWEAITALTLECGWVFPFRKTCIVCDRPIHLSFDEQYRLHAEGKAALRFADGYSLYVYHGVLLPERYAAIHPNRWQPQWLLEEPNAELRRVLIQGIGYGRLCQELQAISLDSWREYTLLRIGTEVDIEPIYLLKMTCPSTNYIHVVRVPPTVQSAREAIRWVNGGIDPEEFQQET